MTQQRNGDSACRIPTGQDSTHLEHYITSNTMTVCKYKNSDGSVSMINIISRQVYYTGHYPYNMIPSTIQNNRSSKVLMKCNKEFNYNFGRHSVGSNLHEMGKPNLLLRCRILVHQWLKHVALAALVKLPTTFRGILIFTLKALCNFPFSIIQHF